MRWWRRSLPAGAIAVLGLVAAGCGGGSGSGADEPVMSAPPSATSPSTTESVSASASAAAPATAPALTAARPCGAAAAAPVNHVIWIWMENRTYSAVLGSGSGAPRLAAYARACGLATNYRAITHPSLPNYLAATSGSTGGVTSDCSPAQCPQNRASLFGQLNASGHDWRTYAESMPSPCNLVSQGAYATKHNPAVYFTPIRSRCTQWDVPMGTATSGPFATALRRSSGLPSFAFVEPDICNDGHDCSTAHADTWLGGWLDRIVASPSYRYGDVAVFVTWDEGVGSDQHIATVVVAPGVKAGTRATGAYTHYSLLRTTEELLGLPLLGAARTATDLRGAFNLS